MPRGRIVVHCDASVKNGYGVGFAFKASISKEGETKSGFRGTKYIQHQMKTTKAEYISIVLALEKIAKNIEKPSNYRLVIYSDCEDAINEFGDSDRESYSDYDKLIKHYCRFFDSVSAFWIPREENTVADSIARSTLERGYEENKA